MKTNLTNSKLKEAILKLKLHRDKMLFYATGLKLTKKEQKSLGVLEQKISQLEVLLKETLQ